jgi:uncharacterized protein YcfJ
MDVINLGHEEYPPLLAAISDPPACIWIRGDRAILQRVAGAVIGGTVGHRVARRDAYGNTYYENVPSQYTRVERRCQVETTYAGGGSRRPVGYDVTYVYDGRTYRTRTATHPGRRIRVEVDRLDGYAYRY